MVKPELSLDFITHNKTKLWGDQFWAHQNDAYQSLLEMDFRGVLQIATAGGKTRIALEIIHDLQVPTLIIVEKKEIMEQWITKINEWFTFAEGKIKGASGKIWYDTSDNGRPIIVLSTSRLLQSVLSSKHASKGNKT
ncbi:hypothetical protein LCGC14_1953090, partial [marine sediment metagenome]